MLTTRQATVLGALAGVGAEGALTVDQLAKNSGFPYRITRRILDTLARSGFAAMARRQSPATWRATEQGRKTMSAPCYREYLAADSA